MWGGAGLGTLFGGAKPSSPLKSGRGRPTRAMPPPKPSIPGGRGAWEALGRFPSPHDADISPGIPTARIPTASPAAMAASPAYGEEKGGSSSLGEPEYGHDPASGGIFSSDYKR